MTTKDDTALKLRTEPDQSPLPAAAQGPEQLIGQVISERYRILSLLGSGGMGSVYLAEHVHMRKTVAVKVLHPEMTALEQAVKRFEREAIASGKLQHPNIVTATDFGRLSSGAFYLVLSYIDGRPLTHELERGPLGEARALHVAAQVADALAAAHQEGIIHRDLKPDNVMLTDVGGDSDFVKVLDFGIAKVRPELTGQSQMLTTAGSVFGTPHYMSPEQAAGVTVDQRSDLYTLGVILYEMVSGRTPFDSDDMVSLLAKHLTQPIPPLPDTVSRSVATLISRLLSKQPEQRPQSAAELASELRYLQRRPLSLHPASWAPHVRHVGRDLSGLEARLRELMTSPVSIRGRTVQTWHLAAAATALLSLAALLATSGTSAEPNAETTTQAGAQPHPSPTAKRQSLRDEAAQGSPRAMERLAQLPNSKRSGEDQLALGFGHIMLGEPSAALQDFELALKASAKLAQSARLLRGVRDLADDPTHFEAAQRLAATYLGRDGADILFDVWSAVPQKTDATRRAEKLLDEPGVRRVASAALRVALDLRDAKGCAAFKKVLERAAKTADERSLTALYKLQSRRGCGFLGLGDCFSCLRGQPELNQALARAKQHPKPKFD